MRVNWQALHVAALSLPVPQKTDYEIRLEGMAHIDLLQEYETVTTAFAAQYRPGIYCERVRLCRRELARRLFRAPSVT